MTKRFTDSIVNNPLMACVKLARYKFVAKLLSKNDLVLDMGCSDGTSTNFFNKYSQKAVGVDCDQEMIEYAIKSFPGIDFIHKDVFEYKPAKKFDVVIALDFIEHLSKADGKRVVEHFPSLLSQKGMVIIGTPSKNFQKYRSAQSMKLHRHEYSPEELESLMMQHFQRVLTFSMNDEIVHSGNSNLAWFIFCVGFYPLKFSDQH